MSQPHDGSYKLLFSHPEMVESLIPFLNLKSIYDPRPSHD